MRTLLVILALAGNLCAATLTGTLVTPNGMRFNGKVVFQLPVAVTDTTNGQAIAPIPTTYYMTNGQFAIATLRGNDVFSPANTFYIAKFYDTAGKFWWQANYVIPNAGSWDIGTAIPTTITTANISFIAPANLAGNNTWAGQQSFSQKLISTVLTGTPPLQITSTTHVPNLNAAYLYSDSANVATAGNPIRLANTDTICWADFIGPTTQMCLTGNASSLNGPGVDILYNFGAGQSRLNISYQHRVMLSGVTALSVNTTNAEQNYIGTSGLIAANEMKIGRIYRVKMSGTVTNTSGGAVTYTFRVRQDNGAGTQLCSTTAQSLATGNSNVPFNLYCDLTVITLGVGGSIDADGQFALNGTFGQIGNGAAETTIDTTVSHDLNFSGQMSVSNAGAIINFRRAVVERIN